MTEQTDTQNPWLALPDVSGAAYDAPYHARAAAGEDVHGEANAVQALLSRRPCSVLDAGCGTGRIAIELARRGMDVVPSKRSLVFFQGGAILKSLDQSREVVIKTHVDEYPAHALAKICVYLGGE